MNLRTVSLVIFTTLLLSLLCTGCNREEPLRRAISLGDTQAVQQILQSNPALANREFRFGRRTPLFYAVNCRNPKETIDLLIASGADINAKSGGFNLTPLQQAVWSANAQATAALLAHKPDVNAVNSDNATALHYGISVYMNALLSGTTNNVGEQLMALLLANGADINHGRSVLLVASHYASNTSLIEFLLSKGAAVNVRESTGGETPLNLAIYSGNKEVVQALLNAHPDLKLGGGNFGAPLATAVELGHSEIALLIQDHVLRNSSNAVNLAAARGSVDELASLLQKNPKPSIPQDELGFTPLHWAAIAGRKESAELLISSGWEIDAKDDIELHPLDWAAFAGHVHLVQLLVEKRAGDLATALFLAVQQRQNAAARYLLEHGANPNARYKYHTVTALHTAARQGNTEIARLLLEHGAAVNPVEQNHSTPLEYAVGQTSKGMVELLFAHGAVVPEQPGFLTVFHEWALGAGDTNIANVLLSHKVDVNAKADEGQTPLHLAARQGQLQAVDWLLQHGGNANARDDRGKTPLGLLRGRQGRVLRKDVWDLLQKYGAKE